MLEVKNLYAGYEPDKMILENVNFSLEQGEHLWVKGANGSGKSTLLKAIMGQVPYISGQVIFRGEDITQLRTWQRSRKGIKWLMQHNAVFGELLVQENLRLRKNQVVNREIHQLLKFYRNQKVSSLSGGQKRKLSSILINYTRSNHLFLLDEISVGLNQSTVKDIYSEFFRINNSSLIFIDHMNLNFNISITKKTL